MAHGVVAQSSKVSTYFINIYFHSNCKTVDNTKRHKQTVLKCGTRAWYTAADVVFKMAPVLLTHFQRAEAGWPASLMGTVHQLVNAV